MKMLGQTIYYMPRTGKVAEPLCVGARVVLEKNLWFGGRLLNGSVGEVLKIKYENTTPTENELPEYVLVKFKNYLGTELYRSDQLEGVPIVPIDDDDVDEKLTKSNKNKKFKYIPLKGAYAFTVHKTQSLTLPRVAVFLDYTEMCTGLDFVSFSRIKRLEDLVILDHHVRDRRMIRSTDTSFYDKNNHHNKFFEAQLNEQERLESLSFI